MDRVDILINGNKVSVDKNITILQAAKELNIKIPSLCYMKLQDGKTTNCKGSCRVCVVEVEGRRNLVASCSTLVSDGMNIKTNTKRVINARRSVVELLLSDHPYDCLKCNKNLKCELQKVAADLGIRQIRYEGEKRQHNIDKSSYSIVKDKSKCINCRRCVTVCDEIQKVHVLTGGGRGFHGTVTTFLDKPLIDTNCTNCGQCVAVCPTGSLREAYSYDSVWDALEDKSKYVIVQVAPSIRVALGEEFGMEPTEETTMKMVGILKSIGFHKVFDTNFGADLTIMEEAAEFLERLKSNKDMPMITSCCPAWVKFSENEYKNQVKHLSSCKSPQQMFGAVAKSYLADKLNINKEDMIVVSIMPCVAKKSEIQRPEFTKDGVKDVDYVITTRELIRMIRELGLNLSTVEEADFDNPLGEATGAGALFGTTGGVMEAALRTAYEWYTGEELKDVNFMKVRGLKGIKEATINIKGKDINIAVASSLGNARVIMDEIELGNSKYDFIEIMACPGGCINGGGQPLIKADTRVVEKRMNGIYEEDLRKNIRKSNENKEIRLLYEKYLGKVNSKKAHEFLHTFYND